MFAEALQMFREAVYASTHASGLTYASIGIAVFMAAFFFKIFFGDFAGFRECMHYWWQCDWISWLRGESVEDSWSELKLFAWFAISAGCGLLSYY